jgi:threonine/homoserine/homoserine lactone efflux protein
MREGLIANLTNPNPLIFMLAFLPQFVDPERGPVAAQLLVLGATQKATGFAILGATALAAGAVGGWLARRPGWIAWQESFCRSGDDRARHSPAPQRRARVPLSLSTC